LKRLTIIMLLLLALVAASACTSRKAARAVPRLNPELLNLTKEEIFERAEKLMADRKFARAREHFSHVYETNPNDPLGRRSLLKIADTYFEQGDAVNLVEAQYKYRDFINRFPGSDVADYAMLQIAMVSYKQMERPDRDQTKTREAVLKFNEMIEAFPNSAHRPEAEKRLVEARSRLARHEHQVARFYAKRGNHEAAVARINWMLETYPDYEQRDEAYFDLANALSALGREGEARLYFERVIIEFPNSSAASRAKSRLGTANASS
jgi:outer membrane protein assembly factor BamD